MQNMSAKLIPIYSANLASFEESYIFGTCAQMRCDIESYAHHFFNTLRIFYIEMAASEGGGEGVGCAYP